VETGGDLPPPVITLGRRTACPLRTGATACPGRLRRSRCTSQGSRTVRALARSNRSGGRAAKTWSASRLKRCDPYPVSSLERSPAPPQPDQHVRVELPPRSWYGL
jgi:hypothetical protein